MGEDAVPDKISGKRLSREVTGGDFDFGRRHWLARNRSWKCYRKTRWKASVDEAHAGS